MRFADMMKKRRTMLVLRPGEWIRVSPVLAAGVGVARFRGGFWLRRKDSFRIRVVHPQTLKIYIPTSHPHLGCRCYVQSFTIEPKQQRISSDQILSTVVNRRFHS